MYLEIKTMAPDDIMLGIISIENFIKCIIIGGSAW